MASRSKPSLWTIFRIPLALAAVSFIGLIAALLYDGPVDLLLAVVVSIPLFAIILCWMRRSLSS